MYLCTFWTDTCKAITEQRKKYIVHNAIHNPASVGDEVIKPLH